MRMCKDCSSAKDNVGQIKCPDDEDKENRPPRVEYLKVKCKWCDDLYYECVDCLLLIQRVGPHNCPNDHVKGLLTRFVPEAIKDSDNGVLCISCHNRSMCDHVYTDISVQK
jgi:hypothetical protein